MKREMDLIRSILLAVEANAGDPRGWTNLEILGKSSEEISYHVQLLADAGYLDANDLSSSEGYLILPTRLTWAGHEFLDAAKNDTVWNQTKEIIKEKGGAIPFEILKALLMKVASAAFGLG